MKKILLLLMAILLFAPPRAKAGDRITSPISGLSPTGTIRNLGNSSITVSGNNYANATPTNNAGGKHNEGGMVLSNNDGFGCYFSNSYTSATPIPKSGTPTPINGYLLGLQQTATNVQYSTSDGQDMIQMLFEVKKTYNGVSIASGAANTANRANVMIPDGSTVRFRTLGGTIHSVNITLNPDCTAGGFTYGTAAQAMTDWNQEQVTLSQNGNIITITPKDGFEKDFKINLGSKVWAFAYTECDWTPVDNIGTPQDIPYLIINGEKIQVNSAACGDTQHKASFGSYTVKLVKATNATAFPEGEYIELNILANDKLFISAPIYGNASTIWTRYAANTATATGTTIAGSFSFLDSGGTKNRAFRSSTTSYFNWGNTAATDCFPHTNLMQNYLDASGTSKANTNTFGLFMTGTQACLMPSYQSDAAISISAQEHTTASTRIRYQSFRPWNSAGTGKTLVLKLDRNMDATTGGGTYNNVAIPEIATDNLPEGCEYNENAKTLYYDKSSLVDGMIKIPVKNNIPWARFIRFTTNGTAPGTATTFVKTTTTTANADKLFQFGDEYAFMEVKPTESDMMHGKKIIVNFLLHDGIGTATLTKTETIFVEYRDPEMAGGGGVQLVQAPLVNTIEDQSILTLAGDAVGFITNDVKVKMTSMADNKGTVQYQFIPVTNNIWPQSPEEKDTDWKEWPADNKLPINATGRLFVREYVSGSECEVSRRDFSKIETTPLDNVAYNTLLNDVPDAASIVTITEPLRVVGFFPLSDDNTGNVYLMFVADKSGNVLRVHVEGEDVQKYDEAYKGYQLIDGLTGVLRKNKEMPELFLTNGTIDYTPLISEPYDAPADYPAYEPEFVQRVPQISDYSKLMYFGPLRWNDTEKTFYDNDNNTVKLYQRIETGQSVDDFEKQLIDGVQYRIAGYVGYADGAPVILPRAYVAAPLLRAPNPINDEAIPDQLIEMNVISDELEISVNTKGIAAGTKLQYILYDGTELIEENDERWKKAEEIDYNGTITITTAGTEDKKGELADGGCTIAARLAAGTMRSGVVTVRFNKIPVAKTFENIADFKEVANKIENLPALDSAIDDETHTFYQYTGYARVREITPNYIYIRTTDKDGNLLDDVDADESKDLDEAAKQNRSDNSILIYNENGWNQDVISIDKDGNNVTGTRAPLQVGDIITNFALIPTQSGFGNLVANATDFIRTFRRLDGVTGGTVKPVELNAQDNNVPAFTEADRMLRYSIKNVTISRTANNGAGIQRDVPADDQDATSYTYTLNIPGKPILDNGSVFDANPDLDVMYSENALFNLEGVVMLYKGDIPEGQDGRYMLALKPESFAFSNVATPRAPRITISGKGIKNDGTFVTEATVTLESTTAENSTAADIYYTTDGTDPRYSTTTRQRYKEPFTIKANTVIKAYVRSNGTPNSELADTLFTRTAVDTRYIMNFISQAQEGTPYHLTATAKVVAKGGEYFFLRGTQGHYLPVKDETGNRAIVNNLSAGDYVNDMVITPHIINGNLRGGHVEADHKDLFGATISKPANIDDIEAEPDEVYTITTANARRYVKIMDVKLTGEEFNAEGDELSTHDTQWKLTTNKGEGKDIRVNHNILEPSFNWDDKDQSAAAYYDITGFAMIGDDGEIELWPTEVEKIKTSVAVRASFDKNATNTGIQADGNYNVTFYPYTVVRLTAVPGATIYYQITDTDDSEEVKADRWNVYGHEFAVTKNCYIHAYSVAPGYEESGHTHIYMTLGKGDDTQDPANMSGRLVITHQFNENDVPVITIKPEDNTLAAGTYDIYYTTDGSTPTVDPKNLYKGPFEMPGGGVVLAILKEAAKELPGKVASLNVWYVPTGIDGIDSDRTDSDAVRAEGGNIIAPEGSEVYDLSGRRVNATGLRRGIYIVRVPGAAKAVKIKVD